MGKESVTCLEVQLCYSLVETKMSNTSAKLVVPR